MSYSPKFRTSLLRSARLLSDHLNDLLTAHELNYSLWLVIYTLHERGVLTSIELAKLLNVSKPSIAKRTSTLQQLGLIEHHSSEDKREKNLFLSDKGRALFEICTAKIDQYEAELLAHISAADLSTCSDVLNRILLQLNPEAGVKA